LGNLFLTLKYFPCDFPEDHETYANGGQNFSEHWSEFLYKGFQSLTGWQFSVSEMRVAFLNHRILHTTPQKKISAVRLVAMKNLSSYNAGHLFDRNLLKKTA
jgi:hypothetical protein